MLCPLPSLEQCVGGIFLFLTCSRLLQARREVALTLPCPEPWWAGGQQDIACACIPALHPAPVSQPCIPILYPSPLSEPCIPHMVSPQVLVFLGVFSEPDFVTMICEAAPEAPCGPGEGLREECWALAWHCYVLTPE